MELQRLHISRIEYGENKGCLMGVIEFSGPFGKVELPLDKQLSKDILCLCSDAVVRVSKMVATELTADIIDGSVGLPAPTDNEGN